MSDEALALDAFREVGPGNHFFGCAHTLAHYETAFRDYELSDNDPFETWEQRGSENVMARQLPLEGDAGGL